MSDKILEIHEIVGKANTAMASRNIVSKKKSKNDATYISLLLNNDIVKTSIATHDMCEDILDDKRQGIFLFKFQEKHAESQIWLEKPKDGPVKILKVYRDTKYIKEIDADYVFVKIGLKTFVNGLGAAFDDLSQWFIDVDVNNTEGIAMIDKTFGVPAPNLTT